MLFLFTLFRSKKIPIKDHKWVLPFEKNDEFLTLSNIVEKFFMNSDYMAACRTVSISLSLLFIIYVDYNIILVCYRSY